MDDTKDKIFIYRQLNEYIFFPPARTGGPVGRTENSHNSR